MHDTALELGRLFFDRYLPKEGALRVLEIGSMDVNGTLRSVVPPDRDVRYTGADLAAGPGVDVVIQHTGELPFETASFDAVVSSSCLEHDPQFWTTVDEAVRVTKPGGFIYLSTPSNGQFHSHPLDCWRFYPDAGLALAQWVNRGLSGGKQLVELVESFVFERHLCEWNDMVIVLGKRPLGVLPSEGLSCFPNAKNIRRLGNEGVGRFEQYTEDQRIGAALGLSLHHLMATLRADTQAAIAEEGRPLLSVIVAYDQSRHDDSSFVRCIESIDAVGVEVIVCHDGPLARPMPEISSERRWKLYDSDARTGALGHDSRARGIRLARGLYVAHTDADGFYYPGALAEVSASLQAEPVGALVTHADWEKFDGTVERETRDPGTGDILIMNRVIVRRGLAQAYGFPGRHAGAEADVFLRITSEVGYCRSPILIGQHR